MSPAALVAVRWAVGAAAFAVGAWIAAVNWRVFWVTTVRRQVWRSWVPVVGGAMLALALVTIPVAWGRRWWWIAFFLDWGGLPGHVYTAFWYIRRAGRGP